MTLYFESPVKFHDTNVISTNEAWHSTSPLLAIASYSQDRGGFVSIIDELGESLPDVNYPVYAVSQVTALAWHPDRNFLVIGWENSSIKLWNGIDKQFSNVVAPHTAPIILLQFSEKGGRLVSCDSTGSLVGWKIDSNDQMITVFHHDLKESITHLTFRAIIKNQMAYDIEGLAKAAVNGDEHALDMFSNWRPKTTARKFKVQDGSDNLCFFIGTQAGCVYYVNESGTCKDVLNTEGIPLNYILYHPNKNAVVIMMEGLSVGYFSVDSEGQLTEIIKVKLSGRAQAIRGISGQGLSWAGNSCLAILTGDLTVRIWDLESNDNYILPTDLKNFSKEDDKQQLNETFSCIAFCTLNQTLCAGTNTGHIYFWRKKSGYQYYLKNTEDAWELYNLSDVSGTIKQLIWGSMNLRIPLLSVNCVTKVFIMKEQTLCTSFSENIWATQRAASQILLETANASLVVHTDIQVTDMSINDKCVAFTNGRTISVYDIIWKKNGDSITQELNSKSDKKDDKLSIEVNLINSFTCVNEGIIMYNKNVITLSGNGVEIRLPNSTVITSIPVVPSEGEIIGMDINANYLTIFTMDGFLKIYDLTDKEPKLTVPAQSFYDMCNDFGEIIQAKTNISGKTVALTLAASNLVPDGKLYIWNIDQDSLNQYDFRKSDSDNSENLNETQLLFNKICSNRILLSVYWDREDPRLLVCNAKTLKTSNKKKGYVSLYAKGGGDKTSIKQKLEDEEHIVITMFISVDHGIRIKDIRAVDPESKLLAVATPYIIILSKLSIVRLVMTDFNDLESCNKETKEAILDFSFYLSLGIVTF